MLPLKKLLPLLLTLLIAVTLMTSFIGCSGNNGTGSSGTSSVKGNYPADFSDTDSQLLTSAYTDYSNLKANTDEDTARQQLVSQLNAESGVASAELGDDGYTIFITYKDGDEAAVDTYDSDVPSTGSSIPDDTISNTLSQDTGIFETGLSNSNFLNVDFTLPLTKTDESGNFDTTTASPPPNSTTKSTRVLILCPLKPENVTDAPADIVADLKSYGWTNNNITVDMNTGEKAPGNLVVTPDDYFNLSQYGIILFFGHGDVRHGIDFSDIYLQFCNMTEAQYKSNVQYINWKKYGQLIITNVDKTNDENTTIYSFMIRGDLLKQKIGQLPGSYVQMATCYGSYFNKIFLENGAKVVLGWDKPVAGYVADSAVENMIKLMTVSGDSAYDAYEDNSVQKTYNQFAYTLHYDPKLDAKYNVYLDIFPSPTTDATASSFYLPSWFNVTIMGTPTNYPYVQVNLIKPGGEFGWSWQKVNIPNQADIEIMNVNIGQHFFPPGVLEVLVTPHSADSNDLSGGGVSKQFDINLKPGENDILVNYSQGGSTVNPPGDEPITSTAN
ncbi:MAG: hypothetical protein WCF70_05445 [Dehalococcoidales bacterium]